MAYAEKIGKYWYVRFKDESGKWRRKGCGRRATRTDADFLAKDYSAKELNRFHKSPVRMINSTVEQALITFRDTVLPHSDLGIDKQQSSIRREQSAINNIIPFVQANGLTLFNSFDEDMVRLFLEKRTGEGMSAKTRREERRLLRKFFKWSIKHSYCTENPTDEIVAPKLLKKKPRFFSKEELKKIFELAREPYRLIFMFMLFTGLRTGEVCNLEWRDYNRDLRTLTIRIVSADKKKRTPGNKTKREETIPLCDEAINVLEQRKSANESKQFIFLNQEGSRLDDDNIYRNLMRILRKLKITEASPHTFRHTFASYLVIAGVSIYVVRDLLRHASVKETEIYAHLAKDTTRSAVDKLNQEMKAIVPEANNAAQTAKDDNPANVLPFPGSVHEVA